MCLLQPSLPLVYLLLLVSSSKELVMADQRSGGWQKHALAGDVADHARVAHIDGPLIQRDQTDIHRFVSYNPDSSRRFWQQDTL